MTKLAEEKQKWKKPNKTADKAVMTTPSDSLPLALPRDVKGIGEASSKPVGVCPTEVQNHQLAFLQVS